jgi:tight adherence protein C
MFDFNYLIAGAFVGTLAYVCAGVAVGLVVYAMIRMNQNLLAETHEQFGTEIDSQLGAIRIFLPTGRIGALWIRGLMGKNKVGVLAKIVQMHDKLVKQAGQPEGLLGIELLGMTLMNALIASFALIFGTLLLELHGASLYVLMGAGFLTSLLPFLYISDMRSRRQKSIRRALPYSFDLLTLGVEAGLDFTVAIKRLVEKMGKSALAEEFGRMLHDLQMGSSRRDALAGLRDRIDMMDINLFASALIQADELGSPLGPILKVQSETLREKRFQRAEELAQKAPVKIIFPLAIFILPVTMLIFGIPLFIQMQKGFG